MEALLYIFVSLIGISLVLFAISGNCKCNGVDMPKLARFAIVLFFVGGVGTLASLFAMTISNCPL